MATSILRPIFVPPSAKHTASLIFLHGSGDTGNGVKEWVKMRLNQDLQFPHIKVIYPTAPIRPYTPMNGGLTSVWFDRKQISPFVPEDLKSITDMEKHILELIQTEIKDGIPPERIVLGGFSMGAAMALLYGYRVSTGLAGIFALSAFLNDDSSVYQNLSKKEPPFAPLFQAHGKRDMLVQHEWGKKTFDTLKTYGVEGEFHSYSNLFHELNTDELEKLRAWILKRLPEES